MAGLVSILVILAILTATVNANSCKKPGLRGHLDVDYQLFALEDISEFQIRFDLLKGFLKEWPLPKIGYVDPLYIEIFEFKLNETDMNIVATITDTTINGLLEFKIIDAKMSLTAEKFQINLLFPEISASGQCHMPLTSQQDSADDYGDYESGDIDVTARNLRVQINAYIYTTSDGNFFIEKIKSKLSLETADAKVTGLFDDERASETASRRMSEYLPKYVPYMNVLVDQYLELGTQLMNSKMPFKV